MKFVKTDIQGCYIVELNRFDDERGWFARTFCKDEAKPYLGELEFVQMNHSYNKKKGTFRGMHYQVQPHVEAKLIRCVSGGVMDYVLDLRKESPTFLKWISIELGRGNQRMVFLPYGVAHGFQTFEDDTELLYHHTSFYNKESERGIRHDDPMVKIDLALPISIISEKDRSYPLLTPEFKGITL